MIHQPQFRNNFRDQFAIIETLTIETREIVRKQKLELQAFAQRFVSVSNRTVPTHSAAERRNVYSLRDKKTLPAPEERDVSPATSHIPLL